MATHKSVVGMLVGKLPPPDELDEEPKTKEPEDGDGGDEAAKLSAFEDFLSACGLSTKRADAALKAFDHFMDVCGHGEHESEEEPEEEGDEHEAE